MRYSSKITLLLITVFWFVNSNAAEASLFLSPPTARDDIATVRVEGESGRPCTLLVSTNLTTWSEMTNIVTEFYPVQISDPRSKNLLVRFYALRSYAPIARSARSIYVSEDAVTPMNAVVRSELFPVPVQFPYLIKGNKVALNIYLVDGQGGFVESVSGVAGYSVKMAIGLPGESALSKTTAFTPIVHGWQGILDLSVPAVLGAVGSQESVDVTWELEITSPSGDRRTYAQQPLKILNSLF